VNVPGFPNSPLAASILRGAGYYVHMTKSETHLNCLMSALACSHHLRSDLPFMASRVVGGVTARESFTRIEDRVFRPYNGSRMAKRSAWQMKMRRKSPNVRNPSKADVRESPSGESANVTKGTLGISSGPICKRCSGMVANGCCVPSKPPPSIEVLRNNPSGR
jgi:hypothetical protein